MENNNSNNNNTNNNSNSNTNDNNSSSTSSLTGWEHYAIGSKLLNEKKYELAVEELSKCLEKLTGTTNNNNNNNNNNDDSNSNSNSNGTNSDELNLDLAPVYYDYGRALYNNYIQNSSVLGEIVKQQQETKGVGLGQGGLLGEEEEVEEEEEEQQEQEENTDNPTEATTDPDDLNVCWEILEVARVIYSKVSLIH